MRWLQRVPPAGARELVARGPQTGFPWSAIMHKGQQATTATRGEREPQEGPGLGSNKRLWETSEQNTAKPPNPLLLKSDSH